MADEDVMNSLFKCEPLSDGKLRRTQNDIGIRAYVVFPFVHVGGGARTESIRGRVSEPRV